METSTLLKRNEQVAKGKKNVHESPLKFCLWKPFQGIKKTEAEMAVQIVEILLITILNMVGFTAISMA